MDAPQSRHETAADDARKNPLGPTGGQVQRNVQRLREARGMSKRDLSALVGKRGRPIPPLGISRIEAGERRVDADDLVALASAFGVNVSTLLLPPVADETAVEITGYGMATTKQAWNWADGFQPLPSENVTALLEFQLYARPPELRDTRTADGLSNLLSFVQEQKLKTLRSDLSPEDRERGLATLASLETQLIKVLGDAERLNLEGSLERKELGDAE